MSSNNVDLQSEIDAIKKKLFLMEQELKNAQKNQLTLTKDTLYAVGKDLINHYVFIALTISVSMSLVEIVAAKW